MSYGAASKAEIDLASDDCGADMQGLSLEADGGNSVAPRLMFSAAVLWGWQPPNSYTLNPEPQTFNPEP